MSTQQENLTPISKTSDNINKNFVKREKASSVLTKTKKSDNICREKISDNEKNFKEVLKRKVLEVDALQSQSKFSTFGDLLNAAEYLNGNEKLDEPIYDNEDSCDEKLIIDIGPTVLQQEQSLDRKDFGFTYSNPEKYDAINKARRNYRNINAKKRFSDFLNSFCVLCDICDDRNTQRVIKLNRVEKIVAAVILMKSFGVGIPTKKIFPLKIPEQSCGRCFTKIILFYNLHKNRYTQKKIKKETGQVMDQRSHGYNCQCLTCQNQYGSLPVLLKGIEEQTKLQDSQLQINYQPEHNVENISQNLIDYQRSISIPTCQSQEHVHYQFPIKYETDLPTPISGSFHTLQPSTQSYSHYQMPQSQMEVNLPSSSKTEQYLGQTEQRLTIQDQTQFDLSFQPHSQYYSTEISMSNIQHPVESTSSAREEHLPTLLKELEDRCQTDLAASQPSTSSGITGQNQGSDEKQSKKVLTCEHCNKNFTHKGDFNKHLRKHTKERPYKCSYCDKMFSHTSNLHRHQRIHSGDRPFRCQHCDKCFNRKDKLESHKNSKFCKNRRNWK